MWPKHPANPKAYPDLPLYDGDKVIKLNPEPGELTKAYTGVGYGVQSVSHDAERGVFHGVQHVIQRRRKRLNVLGIERGQERGLQSAEDLMDDLIPTSLQSLHLFRGVAHCRVAALQTGCKQP